MTAGGLGDVAVAAFQDGFAAPAVFGQLLEWHGPARQVQLRLAGQDQRPVGAQRHLPEGRAMRPSMLSRPASSPFRAQAAYRAGLRAGGHGQVDRVAGLDPVDRAGFAREQRREQVQRAAACQPPALSCAARLVHVQAAAMVGGDAVAGAQVDVGETQRQARLVQAAGGLGVRAVAELDAFGLDVQRPWPVPAPLLTTPAARRPRRSRSGCRRGWWPHRRPGRSRRWPARSAPASAGATCRWPDPACPARHC